RVVLGSAGHHLGPLVGHDDGQLLGTDVDAGGAAHTLVGVHLGRALDDGQGVKPAGLHAVAKAGAAEGAVVGQVHLHRLPASGGPGLGIDLVVVPPAPAADKGDRGLDLGQVVVGV